jgi:glycosyltransferase involved in cell wall biosynthesis
VRILIAGPLPEHAGGRTTGGVATHVETLAAALASLGHEVAVYADNMHPAPTQVRHDWGAAWARAPLERGGRLALFARPSAWAPAVRTLAAGGPGRLLGKSNGWLLSNALGIREAASALQPDVVHYHQPDVRPLYGRLAGITAPSVITLHSLAAFDPGAPPALTALARTNLVSATELIAVSPDVRDGLPPDSATPPVAVVPNGVDLAAFTRSAASHSLDPPSPVILCVGRVTRDKGVVDLLEATALLLERVPDARLVVAGPPVDVDVAAEAERIGLDPARIETPGSVPTLELVRLLHRAAVLVMPSRLREGQGRVIIEAMAAGVPVVATSVGAVPGLLEHGDAGVLSPPGDLTALASAIVSVLEDRALRERLVNRGSVVASQFEIARVAADVAAVYERAIASDSPRTKPPADPVIP